LRGNLLVLHGGSAMRVLAFLVLFAVAGCPSPPPPPTAQCGHDPAIEKNNPYFDRCD
jgi:hypothetical protein